MSRREKIEAMLAEEPGDTFLRYSLAMELDKEGDHAASLAKFAELTRDRRPYVPAFFMAAQQLARLGRLAEARGDQVVRAALSSGLGQRAVVRCAQPKGDDRGSEGEQQDRRSDRVGACV